MSVRKILKKFFRPVRWKDLRTVKPVSSVFGFDRGTPIDRYYIEKFLTENQALIRGRVLEIGDNTYSLRFGGNRIQSEVLAYTRDNTQATLFGDLTDPSGLPADAMDCFICTQTFNFIYDFKHAIEGTFHLLKKDGVLLATLAGISQISRYDMDRWGDYWRFTTKSAEIAFAEVFGKENVTVEFYGNVLACVGLLHGISTEELTTEELDVRDRDYPVTITVVARKR